MDLFSLPVLLDFVLVSTFMFSACSVVTLPRLLAHPPLRRSSAIANPLGWDYAVDCFNQKKKLLNENKMRVNITD